MSNFLLTQSFDWTRVHWAMFDCVNGHLARRRWPFSAKIVVNRDHRHLRLVIDDPCQFRPNNQTQWFSSNEKFLKINLSLLTVQLNLVVIQFRDLRGRKTIVLSTSRGHTLHSIVMESSPVIYRKHTIKCHNERSIIVVGKF